ncbi:lysosomal acid glucosylceramidase-like [Diabrotica undecimpunctata]|uniref:lysosomal acid glucosylceramidase-like n=1 Tax=Diabrotica undecimpunctata TaxID=50387 RepID=UPI003B634B0D
MKNFGVVYKTFYLLICAASFGVCSETCVSRDYGNGGTVCVCTDSRCHTIPPVQRLPSNQYVVYTSNKQGERLTKSVKTLSNSPPKECRISYSDRICDNNDNSSIKICGERDLNPWVVYKEGRPYFPSALDTVNPNVYIDTHIQFQKIIGFGGAFTDSTGLNIKDMSSLLQDHLMRSYFSEEGLEYNMGRVPMGSTDFSIRAYSYMDSEDEDVDCVDPTLRSFQLAQEDFEFKIPYIQEAMRISPSLQLFASAWVAPKVFKENNSYRGTMGFIKRELYELYAKYFVTFLDKYLQNGVNFWGISTGNEPFVGMLHWDGIPGVLWMPDDLGLWVRDYLGPAIKHSAHKNIKLITVDDQRSLIPRVLQKIMFDQQTFDLIDGIGLHWYLDTDNNTHLLDKTHMLYPTKFMLGTEACAGDFENNVRLGNWTRAELYAKDIIQDLNHWVQGWVDWNMVLNTKGGPSLAGPVDSPIIANVTEFYKQPQYYALGHFSKFIPRGSVRIYSSQCDNDNKVDLVAFKRPDGGKVVVILNRNDYPIERTIIPCDRSNIELQITAHSITTVLFW